MKSSRFKIIFVLLVLILIGLLILFLKSRNIYEGATPAAAPPTDANIYSSSNKTLDFSRDSKFKLDCSPPISAAGTFNGKDATGGYFINIYYFTPNKDQITISESNLPIAFINHNLPTTYNVYFSNMNDTTNFGGNISPTTSTLVFIEKTGTSDAQNNYDSKSNKPNFITSSDVNVAGSDKSKKIINLKDWSKPNVNWISGTKPVWSSRYGGSSKINDDTLMVQAAASPTSPPTKQEYKKLTTKNIICCFPVQYNPNPKLTVDKTLDTNSKIGLVNLVNIYVKLN
jgi:hypothetical protein